MLRLFLRFLNPTSYESYVAFQREAFLIISQDCLNLKMSGLFHAFIPLLQMNQTLITAFKREVFLNPLTRQSQSSDEHKEDDYHLTCSERADGRQEKRDLSITEKVYDLTSLIFKSLIFFRYLQFYCSFQKTNFELRAIKHRTCLF